MCDLYSLTRSPADIRQVFGVTRDLAGPLGPLAAISPGEVAPVVRLEQGARTLAAMRWGLPPPSRVGGGPATTARNVKSVFWKRWLGVEHRCLVPFTAFCELAETKPKKTPVWFALSDERPLGCFAGVWISSTGALVQETVWLTAPKEEALKLQRPLPDGMPAVLAVGARGARRAQKGLAFVAFAHQHDHLVH